MIKILVAGILLFSLSGCTSIIKEQQEKLVQYVDTKADSLITVVSDSVTAKVDTLESRANHVLNILFNKLLEHEMRVRELEEQIERMKI